MATERIDGTFTETEELAEAHERFLKLCDIGQARSFHVGTELEIEEIKNKRSIEDRLDALESDIKPTSDILELPTDAEIKKTKDWKDDGD